MEGEASAGREWLGNCIHQTNDVARMDIQNANAVIGVIHTNHLSVVQRKYHVRDVPLMGVFVGDCRSRITRFVPIEHIPSFHEFEPNEDETYYIPTYIGVG
jgi:hypothetical protein